MFVSADNYLVPCLLVSSDTDTNELTGMATAVREVWLKWTVTCLALKSGSTVSLFGISCCRSWVDLTLYFCWCLTALDNKLSSSYGWAPNPQLSLHRCWLDTFLRPAHLAPTLMITEKRNMQNGRHDWIDMQHVTHTLPIWVWHWSPVNLDVQEQKYWKPPERAKHVPLFMQGPESQGLAT